MQCIPDASHNDPNAFYIAAFSEGWGVRAFMTAIEYKYFHPDNQELNKQMELSVIKF